MRETTIYKRLLAGGIGLFFLFLVSGCGDNIFSGNDSSLEAKIEEAKIALDEGDYDSAKNTLEDICGTDIQDLQCDSDMISLFASAYMGAAGLDVINLIDTAESASSNDNTAAFDMFANIIQPSNIDNLQNAMDLLNEIDDAERTTEQELQLAVASASHMVASIIAAAAPDFDIESPETTEYHPENVDEELVGIVTTDFVNAVDAASEVANAVTEGEIDLTSEIEGFREDIDGDSDGTIDSGELTDFINNL